MLQIQEFSKAKNPIMLATDVAGRGLDLENVDIVVQFDIPKQSRLVFLQSTTLYVFLRK